jgi:hypothetical protein
MRLSSTCHLLQFRDLPDVENGRRWRVVRRYSLRGGYTDALLCQPLPKPAPGWSGPVDGEDARDHSSDGRFHSPCRQSLSWRFSGGKVRRGRRRVQRRYWRRLGKGSEREGKPGKEVVQGHFGSAKGKPNPVRIPA